jgi:hypothetical protein
MPSWTSTFEATPAGSSSPSDGDDRIRELKVAIEERMQNEHTTHNDTYSNGTVAKDWLHKSGSASAYYQSAEPDKYPDETTSLDSNAKGRLWFNPDKTELKVYDGSSWLDLIIQDLTRTFIQGTLFVGSNIGPLIIFPKVTNITKVSVRVKTAPVGSALRIDINKNGGDNSIFGTPNYIEITDGTYTATSTDIDGTNGSLAADDYLTIDIDQVGSDVSGKDLSISIVGTLGA